MPYGGDIAEQGAHEYELVKREGKSYALTLKKMANTAGVARDEPWDLLRRCDLSWQAVSRIRGSDEVRRLASRTSKIGRLESFRALNDLVLDLLNGVISLV